MPGSGSLGLHMEGVQQSPEQQNPPFNLGQSHGLPKEVSKNRAYFDTAFP